MREWLSGLGLAGVWMFMGVETFVACLVAIAVFWLWDTRRHDQSDTGDPWRTDAASTR